MFRYLRLILVHQLCLSLLHCLHLLWVELGHLNFAWQMMRGEENVHIVCVKDLSKVLIHQINVHFWTQWQSLYEEHRVLKLFNIWMKISLPDYFDNLLESAWDKSTVWFDLDGNWSWSVHKESNWALLAGVWDSELRDHVTLKVLEA